MGVKYKPTSMLESARTVAAEAATRQEGTSSTIGITNEAISLGTVQTNRIATQSNPLKGLVTELISQKATTRSLRIVSRRNRRRDVTIPL